MFVCACKASLMSCFRGPIPDCDNDFRGPAPDTSRPVRDLAFYFKPVNEFCGPAPDCVNDFCGPAPDCDIGFCGPAPDCTSDDEYDAPRDSHGWTARQRKERAQAQARCDEWTRLYQAGLLPVQIASAARRRARSGPAAVTRL